jgi:hypothetical protein
MLFAECLNEDPRPAPAFSVELELPEQTTALRELAMVVTKQAVEHTRSLDRPADEQKTHLARLLNNLGVSSARWAAGRRRWRRCPSGLPEGADRAGPAKQLFDLARTCFSHLVLEQLHGGS